MRPYKCYEDLVAAQLGVDMKAKAPELEHIWFSYKEGEVVKCASKLKAQQVGGLIERVVTPESKQATDDYYRRRIEVSETAYMSWYADLVAENSDVKKEIFTLCYSESYDRYHSSGYDEVAGGVRHYIDLVLACIKLSGQCS